MEADLVSGRRLINLHALRMEDLEMQSHWSPLKRCVPQFLFTNAGYIIGCAKKVYIVGSAKSFYCSKVYLLKEL